MKLFKNNRWLLIPILSSLLLLVLMKTVLFVGYVPTDDGRRHSIQLAQA